MKNIHLTLILILGIFSTQGWAPPPGKGGATGGIADAQDISKCKMNPSKQTKLKVKGEDGKVHFVCTGPITCEGKAVPIYCKVSEKEACPSKDECIYLGDKPVEFLKTQTITTSYLNFTLQDKTKIFNDKENCSLTIYTTNNIPPKPQSRHYLIEGCLARYKGPSGEGTVDLKFNFSQRIPENGKYGYWVDLKLKFFKLTEMKIVEYNNLQSANPKTEIYIYELVDKDEKFTLKFITKGVWYTLIDNPDYLKFRIDPDGEGRFEIK